MGTIPWHRDWLGPPDARAGAFTARWLGPLAFGATINLLAIAALRVWALSHGAFRDLVGSDLDGYLASTRRWLETGSPYTAQELAGQFQYSHGMFLHPPIALPMFLPFLILPAFLWWAIPMAITLGVIASWRPGWGAIVLVSAGLALSIGGPLVVGNTDIWVQAFVALGLRWGWPFLLVILKPSFAPLFAIGALRSRWWTWLPAGALACLPFGALWWQWLRAIANSPGDVAYSALSVPFVLLPIIPWLGRQGARA